MKRGDLVSVSLPGDYGKPRPALIIQSDLFAHHPSVTVVPLTSALRDTPMFRITVDPDDKNGLRVPSQAMVDKIHTLHRERLGKRIGSLNQRVMLQVNRALAVFLGFA